MTGRQFSVDIVSANVYYVSVGACIWGVDFVERGIVVAVFAIEEVRDRTT